MNNNTNLKQTDDYRGQAAVETLKQLQVGAAAGLSDSEAQSRLQRYGYNEVSEKEEPFWHRVFRRFWLDDRLDNDALYAVQFVIGYVFFRYILREIIKNGLKRIPVAVEYVMDIYPVG